MTTISARVDDGLKDDAEDIANTLGLSLSAVINVFLKRFVAENGFPFTLKIPSKAPQVDFFNMTSDEISKFVKTRVAEASLSPATPPFAYLDPTTGELITHTK